LHRQLAEGETKEVAIVLKCDVQGLRKHLSEMLTKLSTDKVKVRILHSSVGAITETDVLLARGFERHHHRVQRETRTQGAELANREKGRRSSPHHHLQRRRRD
jgi:translation initiation factor IF-2